jgi:hypothetical protein
MNNFYVKVCLTAIVLLLTAIVLKPILSPTLAEAQSSISGVQVSAQGSGGFLLYDNNTGRLWAYDLYRGDIAYWGRVKELGKPLVKDLPAEKQ